MKSSENSTTRRFLRKRYKDPITGKDAWKLIHVGEAIMNLAPPGGQPGSGSDAGGSKQGGSNQGGSNQSGNNQSNSPQTGGTGQSSPPSSLGPSQGQIG